MRTLFLAIIASLFSITLSAQNIQTSTCNCCTETHAQFDFWVGEWTVTQPNGSPAGKNSLEKIQDQCVLKENWTSAKEGYTGTSYSFYNAETKQWEQVWIDNQGGSLHLKGHKKDNQMILRTDDAKNKDGEIFYHQITWTDNKDGSVRQLWETFTEGKDAVVAFDGLYKKTK